MVMNRLQDLRFAAYKSQNDTGIIFDKVRPIPYFIYKPAGLKSLHCI